MTEQELRELDAWIAEHVFGLPVGWENGRRKHGPGFLWFIAGVNGAPNQCEIVKNYSTDRAASQEVLERCIATVEDLHIQWNLEKRCYEIWGGGVRVTAETLPTCTAIFAKKLFGKE